MISTLAWIVWGIAAMVVLFLFMNYLSCRRTGDSHFFGLPALVLAIGLIVTVIFPISKFHLLWIALLGVIWPIVLMQRRIKAAEKKSEEKNREGRESNSK